MVQGEEQNESPTWLDNRVSPAKSDDEGQKMTDLILQTKLPIKVDELIKRVRTVTSPEMDREDHCNPYLQKAFD